MSDHRSNLRASHARVGCMCVISRLHRAVCQLLPQPRWRRESLVLHRRGLRGRGDGLGLLRRVRRVSVITAAVAVSAAAVAQPATAVAQPASVGPVCAHARLTRDLLRFRRGACVHTFSVSYYSTTLRSSSGASRRRPHSASGASNGTWLGLGLGLGLRSTVP